jgi:hypothetical protein
MDSCIDRQVVYKEMELLRMNVEVVAALSVVEWKVTMLSKWDGLRCSYLQCRVHIIL